METIHTIAWMKQVAREVLAKDKIIGLVPTMGALHEGHLSLVRKARAECSAVVVSLFVNPRQFGPAEDLKKYPRSLESDRAALEKLGVDYLFAPAADEMYPDGFQTAVEVGELANRLEGNSRPGHFRGVATVVLKLFEIVRPQFAYFGRKDAQQAHIVQKVAIDLDLDTQPVICPIIRDSDGLALSSRNSYLSSQERRVAPALYRSLRAAARAVDSGERSAARLLSIVGEALATEPKIKIDYAEIVDADTFEPIAALRAKCLILLAALIGSTRLIDNALIEQANDSFRVTV